MAGLGVTMDAAHLVGWGNVYDYVHNLDERSATWRALNPELAAFASPVRQSAMLADVFDAVQNTMYAVVKMHHGRMGRPKPYPRPKCGGDGQSFGKGAIDVSGFEEWYYQDQEPTSE